MKLGLWVFRAVFILGCVGAGLAAHRILDDAGVYDQQPEIARKWLPFMIFIFLVAGVLTVVLDLLFSRRPVQSFTAVFFGLLAGLITAALFRLVLDATPLPKAYVNAAYLTMLVIFCYLGVTVIIQTKDNFRFIVPYVEFSRETRGHRPIILDTSVIIDGRVADVCETGFLDAPIVIPRFVLQELQVIADAEDKVRRKRGRRGLDMLNRLRRNRSLDVIIHDTTLAAGEMVDSKLINLAKLLDGRIMTNDFNLNKIAELQNVEVVNINELANALKSVVVAGERIAVDIIKVGEEPGQGVGYLDDGTMVVVDGGGSAIGRQVNIMVTSVLQTSAGRMVFGRPVDAEPAAGRAAGGRRA